MMCSEDKVLKELNSLNTMVQDLVKDREDLDELKSIVNRHALLLDQYLNGVNIRGIQHDAEDLLKTTKELKEIIKENKRPDKWDKLMFGLITIIGAFAFYTRS